jgi:hypothetical protein
MHAVYYQVVYPGYLYAGYLGLFLTVSRDDYGLALGDVSADGDLQSEGLHHSGI